jgi:hypothetical protein
VGCWEWCLGLRGGGVAGDWIKLRNDELRDLISSPNNIRDAYNVGRPEFLKDLLH